MKWSDNDDNWRDYAEAHPAQVERIREAGRRSDPKRHPAQAPAKEPGTDTPYGRTHPDYPGWYEDDIP